MVPDMEGQGHEVPAHGVSKESFYTVGYENVATVSCCGGLLRGGAPTVLTNLGDHGVSLTYDVMPPRNDGVELQSRF